MHWYSATTLLFKDLQRREHPQGLAECFHHAASSQQNYLRHGAEIGAPLFFRSSRGLVPTEIGLQLKKLAQPVVDAMDKLNEEISSAVQLQSNNLSLGVSCGLQYFLPQAGLREFSQTHRTFRFSLRKVTAANAKRSLPPVTILPR